MNYCTIIFAMNSAMNSINFQKLIINKTYQTAVISVFINIVGETGQTIYPVLDIF